MTGAGRARPAAPGTIVEPTLAAAPESKAADSRRLMPPLEDRARTTKSTHPDAVQQIGCQGMEATLTRRAAGVPTWVQ